ncbi:L,D-transpeptidase [Phascolarctobacterium faecium]|uniref:L,D-transpeptidase n=1 Tax=Phascolarctobacterium faecium TaxID=33025 RepID=UPI003AEF207C
MSKSYKDQFKEESVRRRQRQQKQIAAVIILIGVLVSAAIWYLDGLSKEQHVPQQTSQQQSAQTAEQPGQEVKPETPAAEPPKEEQKQPEAPAAEPPKEEQKQPEAVKPAYTILIDKSEYKLYVLKDNEVIKQWGVAVGAKPGQKQRAGDMTTPTGNFEVDEILDASYWTHDFGDGKGEIKGAYGPNFISLVTGWDGIGIHGTHAPESIGTMVSEGCVRMRNGELLELLPYVEVGTKVTIRE